MEKRYGLLFAAIVIIMISIVSCSPAVPENTNMDDNTKNTETDEIVQKEAMAEPIDDSSEEASKTVTWMYQGGKWVSQGEPPACTEPLVFPAPVDLSLASGILYPGQIRGGDYKAHGGVRFDKLPNNLVEVYAPIDGKLIEGARHRASGEVQYALYFLDDCGLIYKFDHLRELTPKFEEIINKIPLGGEDDTRTTRIQPAVFTKKGELIATKVGLESTKNIFLDFGFYDLRKKNGVDYTGKNYYNIEQYGEHALCWLDYLEEPDKTLVNSLPAADGKSGKDSDYC